jgi:tripartite-type tricarboxylate transporter receptor subunit TctC
MRSLCVCGVVVLLSSAASADAIEDFYRGKTITMIVGVAPGGDYDLAARLVGKYLTKHLPGSPAVAVQNMPGAGGIAAMNFMYSAAPKDGMTLAVMQRAMPQLAYVGAPNIHFDASKFTWLGTMSSYAGDAYPIFIMADRPIQSWRDLRQPGKKVAIGAVGSGSTNLTFPLIARDVLKLNIDIVRGYSGASAIYLGMQDGEVDGQAAGYASIKATQRTLFEQKKLRFLIQFGRNTRLPELADVPTGEELAANDADRTLISFAEAPFFMAMPFIAPPRIPEPRAAALRDAFSLAMDDPEFRAEAKKFGLDASPLGAEAVVKLVHGLAETPPEIVERYRAISAAN